jgi:hypothetical protein
MSKKKKMTTEELNEILRKRGELNESLSIFPDDKYSSILPIALGQAASRAFWEPEPKAKKRSARKKKGADQ